MRKKIDAASLFAEIAQAVEKSKPKPEAQPTEVKAKDSRATTKIKKYVVTPKIEAEVPHLSDETAPAPDDLPWHGDKTTAKKQAKAAKSGGFEQKTPTELNAWLMDCSDVAEVAKMLNKYVLAGDKVRYAQAVGRIYSRLNKLRGAMERKALKHGVVPASIEVLL